MKKTNPIFRVLAVVLILASLGMVFLPWMTVSAFGYSQSGTYYELVEALIEAVKNFGIDAITETAQQTLLAIAVILLVITAILGIILAACGVRGGGIPYFIASLLNLGFIIYMVIYANNEMGMNIAHLGIGAILCPVFALAAMILLFIPDNAGARPAYGGAYGGAAPLKASPSTWTCPSCGTILADRERFCPNCGSARKVTPPPAPAPAPVAPVTRAPAGWTCPGCGAKLKDSQKFCPNCGTRQPEKAAPAAPARPAAPAGWTCPGCGTKLKDSQKFCPNCGTRQPEKAAPAAPARPAAPAGWTCPGCGTKLKDSQKFCPNCGTRKPEPAAAPAPAAPAAPTFTAPAEPIPTPPASPAYTAPETPAYAPKHESPAPSGGFYNAGDEDL